ncbi:hypothetical protein HID58_081904 [Brassica napus]|uniref:Uncharacterized protein n=1 Tax=Brassica napus TaxID=3708 RepID=A0ABQ7Y907_BRANA|nr:hypothetical protein HID58_081904 [Brassica napus]
MTIYLKTIPGKVWSLDSLELTGEASSLTIPALDILFHPRNAKASRRYMREETQRMTFWIWIRPQRKIFPLIKASEI